MKCEYCGKTFKLERTISTHMCEHKRRYFARDEQHVKLGLKFFNDWYRQAMGTKKNKTYDEFSKSQYYTAFIRFGLYVLESRVLYPEKYIEWLIVNKTRLNDWSKDSVYNKYLAEQSKKETPERALERFVLHAQDWSETTGHQWNLYWNEVSMNRMVYDIKMGKISPWVFLSYPPAKERLEDIPHDLLIEVADTIDLQYWQRKIAVNKPTVDWIQEIMD